MKTLTILSLVTILFTSCFGDKKSAIGTDFNDESFINKSFKTKVSFNELQDACSYVNASQLASLYNVAEEAVVIIKSNVQNKTCSVRIKLSDDDYNYLSGSIHFYKEKDVVDESTTWVQTWQLQKGMSKSAEWISDFGKASLWIDKKRELRIKLDNYVCSIVVPYAAFNKEELAKNRDYKKIAIAIANQISFLKN